MHAVRPTGLIAAAAVLTVAITGCGGGSQGSGAPQPHLSWSPDPAASGLVQASVMPNSKGRQSNTKTATWTFHLPDKGDPNVPSDQWPDASEVVTSILISNGDMAGWIDLSFGAFYSLATNPVDAQNVLKTQVFPLIAEGISAHLPRRYA
ncbi:hypothetical protein [Leekyejoonella antrihumi]|uniref:Uncharacterized protein n=1 Tax=Leekyejoonella antrihumi TaxID=1660198 RepID=A0A563DY40_9MICO|nr:hypothetical protein [Leekyejoonella antrihumi]TWP35125.1 hypothetical protein FGL98_15360 [Leekyejoonella antrihumi]